MVLDNLVAADVLENENMLVAYIQCLIKLNLLGYHLVSFS